MKHDITTRKDIDILVKTFYDKLLKDDLLQELFQKTVLQHLEAHLKLVADFWDSILLDADNYKGNVIEKHFNLDKQFPLNKAEFDRWLLHWTSAINELYAGEKADLAKFRANSIADIMQYKLEYIRKIAK